MSAEYSVEEVRDLIGRIYRHAITVSEKAEVLTQLTAYADLLERIKSGEESVAVQRISIPTETMEQEFQAHYRRGFEAGKASHPPAQAAHGDDAITEYYEHRNRARSQGSFTHPRDVQTAPTAEPVAQGEVVAGLMSSEGDYTVIDCPACGRCVKYSKKDASSKAAYRDLCAEVAALRAENDSLRTLAAQPRAVPAERVVDGWVLVPREPTPEMLAAVAGMEISVRVAEDDTAEYPVPEDDCAEIYRAMLAAAPQPGESQS